MCSEPAKSHTRSTYYVHVQSHRTVGQFLFVLELTTAPHCSCSVQTSTISMIAMVTTGYICYHSNNISTTSPNQHLLGGSLPSLVYTRIHTSRLLHYKVHFASASHTPKGHGNNTNWANEKLQKNTEDQFWKLQVMRGCEI